MDWAKRDGIKYSYTVELRPHVNTSYPFGFIRPYTDIIPSGEEVWPGVVMLVEKVLSEWKAEENLKTQFDFANSSSLEATEATEATEAAATDAPLTASSHSAPGLD